MPQRNHFPYAQEGALKKSKHAEINLAGHPRARGYSDETTVDDWESRRVLEQRLLGRNYASFCLDKVVRIIFRKTYCTLHPLICERLTTGGGMIEGPTRFNRAVHNTPQQPTHSAPMEDEEANWLNSQDAALLHGPGSNGSAKPVLNFEPLI